MGTPLLNAEPLARVVFLVGPATYLFSGNRTELVFELHESQNARVKKPYRVPHLHKQLQNDSKPTSCGKKLT